MTDPEKWLLTHSEDGRPFGDGAPYDERCKNDDTAKPWDEKCTVECLIGGKATMDAIRDTFKKAIDEVSNPVADQDSCGHVYIAGWRFNPNRDMSSNSACKDDSENYVAEDIAWDLICEMLDVGIKIRIMLWLPTAEWLLREHIKAHIYTARLMKAYCEENDYGSRGVVLLDTRVADLVDLKIADYGDPTNMIPVFFRKYSEVGSHHQKFIVVRVGTVAKAFCGGVDLAYTRRDYFDNGTEAKGDWQSGNNMPTHRWGINMYDWENEDFSAPTGDIPSDLVEDVYGETNQMWHDQHLQLEGPIVSILERIYCARWVDVCRSIQVIENNKKPRILPGGVIISTREEVVEEIADQVTYSLDPTKIIDVLLPPMILSLTEIGLSIGTEETTLEQQAIKYESNFTFVIHNIVKILKSMGIVVEGGDQLTITYKIKKLAPLDVGDQIPDGEGNSTVQAWQTIPLRKKSRFPHGDNIPTYSRGEFSVLAGLSNALQQAQELVFVADQYFISLPYARLLREMLISKESLHAIILLPPHSDMSGGKGKYQHKLRHTALHTLMDNLDASVIARIKVCVLWHFLGSEPSKKGIYCHAKTQVFDDQLLVCGSSNTNRRSLLCDTELNCAIHDPKVIRDYYSQMWTHLFGSSPPTINCSGWGADFLDSFVEGISKCSNGDWQVKGEIIEESLDPKMVLPSGFERESESFMNTITQRVLNYVYEPSSVNPEVYQTKVKDGCF